MEFAGWLNAILTTFAMVSAGLAALLFGSLKALRDSNNDLRDRDADREVKMAALSAKVAELETARDVLAGQLRGDDKIDMLAKKLDGHHAESIRHWTKGEAILTGIYDEMTGGNKL